MNQSSIRLFYRNSLFALVVLAGTGLMSSCEDELEPLTTNSVIQGSAYAIGVYEEPSEIAVVASGPFGQKSIVANAYEEFTISGLANGTYYLDYSKEGYGTVRQYGIQLFGNDTVRTQQAALYENPPASFVMPRFTNVTINTVSEYYVEILITTDYPTQHTFWQSRLFMGVENEVSCDRFSKTYAITCNYANEIIIPVSYYSFQSGTTVNLIGYSCNTYDQGYLDTYLGKMVYSTLDKDNHSNVVSFIMP